MRGIGAIIAFFGIMLFIKMGYLLFVNYPIIFWIEFWLLTSMIIFKVGIRILFK